MIKHSLKKTYLCGDGWVNISTDCFKFVDEMTVLDKAIASFNKSFGGKDKPTILQIHGQHKFKWQQLGCISSLMSEGGKLTKGPAFHLLWNIAKGLKITTNWFSELKTEGTCGGAPCRPPSGCSSPLEGHWGWTWAAEAPLPSACLTDIVADNLGHVTPHTVQDAFHSFLNFSVYKP